MIAQTYTWKSKKHAQINIHLAVSLQKLFLLIRGQLWLVKTATSKLEIFLFSSD